MTCSDTWPGLAPLGIPAKLSRKPVTKMPTPVEHLAAKKAPAAKVPSERRPVCSCDASTTSATIDDRQIVVMTLKRLEQKVAAYMAQIAVGVPSGHHSPKCRRVSGVTQQIMPINAVMIA